MKVILIPYDDFAKDWNSLGADAKKAVGSVLQSLYRDPYETEFQKNCVLHGNERYAYPLPKVGYAVYWTILSSSQGSEILPGNEPTITVKLTGIERVK